MHDHVGQQVADDDTGIAEPGDARRLDVLAPLGDQDLGPDDARVGDPADHRDRDVDAALARPQHEQDGADQHVERERHHDVHEVGDQRVQLAAVEAGQAAQHGADAERKQHRQEAHLEVDAAGVDQPRPDVASQLIGAQPVIRRRALERVVQVLLDRRVLRHQRCEHRQQHQRAQDRDAGHERRRAVPAARESTRLVVGESCSRIEGDRH